VILEQLKNQSSSSPVVTGPSATPVNVQAPPQAQVVGAAANAAPSFVVDPRLRALCGGERNQLQRYNKHIANPLPGTSSSLPGSAAPLDDAPPPSLPPPTSPPGPQGEPFPVDEREADHANEDDEGEDDDDKDNDDKDDDDEEDGSTDNNGTAQLTRHDTPDNEQMNLVQGPEDLLAATREFTLNHCKRILT
jgi:hypothetical protein